LRKERKDIICKHRLKPATTNFFLEKLGGKKRAKNRVRRRRGIKKINRRISFGKEGFSKREVLKD